MHRVPEEGSQGTDTGMHAGTNGRIQHTAAPRRCLSSSNCLSTLSCCCRNQRASRTNTVAVFHSAALCLIGGRLSAASVVTMTARVVEENAADSLFRRGIGT